MDHCTRRAFWRRREDLGEVGARHITDIPTEHLRELLDAFGGSERDRYRTRLLTKKWR
jgi:hypothetical protein